MKIAKKLLITGIVLILFGFISGFLITIPFAILCFLGVFILVIVQGIMEIMGKNKAPQNRDYQDETQKEK